MRATLLPVCVTFMPMCCSCIVRPHQAVIHDCYIHARLSPTRAARMPNCYQCSVSSCQGATPCLLYPCQVDTHVCHTHARSLPMHFAFMQNYLKLRFMWFTPTQTDQCILHPWQVVIHACLIHEMRYPRIRYPPPIRYSCMLHQECPHQLNQG